MNESNQKVAAAHLAKSALIDSRVDDEGTETGRRSRSKRGAQRRSKRANYKNNLVKASQASRTRTVDVEPNDPAWYSANPQLLKDTFSMSMPYALGMPFSIDSIPHDLDSVGVNESTDYVVSGICTLRLAPGVGVTNNAADAVNLAAQALYAWVRKANAGSINYDAPNLMMYILAMDSAYMLYAWLERAYGVMLSYNQKNRYMPRALVREMGIDYDTVMQDLPGFRSLINTLGYQLKSLAVPKSLALFKRHLSLFRDIYEDHSNLKAQLYQFVPGHLFRFVEDRVVQTSGMPIIGFLEPVEIVPSLPNSSSLWKLDGLQALVDSFIEPIIYSGDFNIMNGDIQKAYPSNELFMVSEMSEGYSVYPIYSSEMLMQIENATILGSLYTNNASKIWVEPETNYLRYNPVVTSNINRMTPDTLLLNFHYDEITPELVAEATRLMARKNPVHTDWASARSEVFTCGSEFVESMRIAKMNPAANTITGKAIYSVYSIDTSTNDFPEAINLIELEHFDWHPLVYIFSKANKGNGQPYSFFSVSGDLDNYTVVYAKQLNQMHRVALLSLLDVPMIAANK